MPHRLRNLLAGLVTGSVTVLMTACALFVFLGRLGDDTGVAWAGRIVIVATIVTVLALAAAFLGDSTSD